MSVAGWQVQTPGGALKCKGGHVAGIRLRDRRHRRNATWAQRVAVAHTRAAQAGIRRGGLGDLVMTARRGIRRTHLDEARPPGPGVRRQAATAVQTCRAGGRAGRRRVGEGGPTGMCFCSGGRPQGQRRRLGERGGGGQEPGRAAGLRQGCETKSVQKSPCWGRAGGRPAAAAKSQSETMPPRHCAPHGFRGSGSCRGGSTGRGRGGSRPWHTHKALWSSRPGGRPCP